MSLTNSDNDDDGDDHYLFNYHDAVIYPSDVSLLDSPTAWLNDAIINFQFTRLQHLHREEEEEEVEEEKIKMAYQNGKKETSNDPIEYLFLDP